MTMLWVGVGAAVLGAGASVYGANKQASASKNAANINLDQNARTRADLLPYTQAGYGATSKLNTLLGINPNPNAARMSTPLLMPPANPGYAPTPGGGVRPIMQVGPAQQGPAAQPVPHQWNIPEAGMGNLPLSRILMIRAAHGDTQAQQMLQRMGP
jgi:hypothetical protein